MSITITENAALYIKKSLKIREKGIGIRLNVKTTGCSGLSYQIEFVDQSIPDDLVFEFFDVKIFVNRKNLLYFNGLDLDYVREGMNEGFKFYNPNIKDQCGCGKSFKV